MLGVVQALVVANSDCLRRFISARRSSCGFSHILPPFTQTRPTSNLTPAAATRSLASIAVGEGQTTFGHFFGHYYPFGYLDAIYCN